MSIRATCPTCGKVEEYTPDEEDIKVAKARGVASISFNHGDHVFIVFFDASRKVRRTTTLKVVPSRPTTIAKPAEEARPPSPRRAVPVKEAPTMPFDDLCSLLGEEKLALMLVALTANARVVVASSSPDLAKSVCSTVLSLMGPVEAVVDEALGPEELRPALSKPSGMVITEHGSLIAIGDVPSHVAVIDLETSIKLSRKERRGLRAMLKAIEKAKKLRGEATKVAFIRSKVVRLRMLFEKALDVLGKMDRIGETVFKRKVDPAITPDELDALYFALKRFKGIDVSKRIVRGPAEFAVRF